VFSNIYRVQSIYLTPPPLLVLSRGQSQGAPRGGFRGGRGGGGRGSFRGGRGPPRGGRGPPRGGRGGFRGRGRF
jgi:H/ACA ribonucleoprotein complex subunit 1